ncbi:MAG: hypothetical protein U0163_20325 [Gemmatimonadaceae bacterium]
MALVLTQLATTSRRQAALGTLLVVLAACSRTTSVIGTPAPLPAAAPIPDARVGLKPGLFDAGKATWNLKMLSETRPQGKFLGSINSDLAFTGNYAIQGSFNGFQVWDISNPSAPTLKSSMYCPASQSDVSVYKNLLFVSAEAPSARLDCGDQGVRDVASKDRIRGIRIFDITDIANPKYITNVQTCRGSHTHSVVVDPKDADNVYVYISGSAPVRPSDELTGCASAPPAQDPQSALFRIEVIKVPVAHPEQAAIVSSPRIFNDLTAPARHGEAAEDIENSRREAAQARAQGKFTVTFQGQELVAPDEWAKEQLDSIVTARKGTGPATSADSATLRAALPGIVAKMFGEDEGSGKGPRPGPTQCHDITVYPAIGLAGGACEGYGLLLDIRNPTNPVRIGAVSDSNFSYWHSATFNNDGTKVLFSDEWGGGGQPKCRATDKKEWGADAIFTLENGQMKFQSYYKMPAAQTPLENCVAHNGSLIPIPGRDVMVQAWYQGGISVFDWTDAAHPVEIAYFDRGPSDSAHFSMAGSWSVYWYNGAIVSSEIARGLDIAELTPSAYLSQNEIDAAKTVHMDYLNAQGQPRLVWPPSFALARAYVDQLERAKCLGAGRISAVRQGLSTAEKASGAARRDALTAMAGQLANDAAGSCDDKRVRMLERTVRDLANVAM